MVEENWYERENLYYAMSKSHNMYGLEMVNWSAYEACAFGVLRNGEVVIMSVEGRTEDVQRLLKYIVQHEGENGNCVKALGCLFGAFGEQLKRAHIVRKKKVLKEWIRYTSNLPYLLPSERKSGVC